MSRYMEIRPYQLMCIFCKSSGGFKDTGRDRKLKTILDKIKKDPDRPLTLVCNVSSNYSYQNPGKADDTPQGHLYNVKRDIDILQIMGLVPGITMPARSLMEKLLSKIKTSGEVCGCASKDSMIWKGCEKADSGDYEIARNIGMNAVILPRTVTEKEKAKRISAKKMYNSKMLSIRPHHLMCMACFSRSERAENPIPEDNLYEAIDIIGKKPEIPVQLVEGPCMICPPCNSFLPGKNLCTGSSSMALRDEKKDLDVLYKINAEYGMVFSAIKLYGKLFSAVKSTKEICGFGDGIKRSEEWAGCGMEGHLSYEKARKEGMEIPGLKILNKKRER